MASINGGSDTTKHSLEDLKTRFALYEDGVRDGYLFVQNLVNLVETVTNRNERLDKEVYGLLNTIRNLERENVRLKDRLTDVQTGVDATKFAAVVLDGDGMMFSRDLLVQGFEGGREAARRLMGLSRSGLNLSQNTKLIVHVFANVSGVASSLAQSMIISKQETFHEFVNGFNTVDEMVTFTSVGRGKELTDSKINGLIKMYTVMPQCQNLILGGSHDNGYARILSKLETENIQPGKVVLLQGPSFAPELERFDTMLFPRIRNSGELFMVQKLEIGKRYSQVAADGVLPMQRKALSPPKTPAVVPHKLVEPELSVWLSVKNLSPRACNMFYLNPLKCSKNDCEYSHDHVLSETQLLALRYNCKKQLCRAYQQSETCPYEEDCIYGHECPDGGKCAQGKKCKLIHPE